MKNHIWKRETSAIHQNTHGKCEDTPYALYRAAVFRNLHVNKMMRPIIYLLESTLEIRPGRKRRIECYHLVAGKQEVSRKLKVSWIAHGSGTFSVIVDNPDSFTHYLKALIKRTISATSSILIAGPIGKLNSSSANFSVTGRHISFHPL